MLGRQLDEQVVISFKGDIRDRVQAECCGANHGLLVDSGQMAIDQSLVRLVERVGD
ncbi:hypothetical protein D3C75_1268830 [compost metagenome]